MYTWHTYYVAQHFGIDVYNTIIKTVSSNKLNNFIRKNEHFASAVTLFVSQCAIFASFYWTTLFCDSYDSKMQTITLNNTFVDSIYSDNRCDRSVQLTIAMMMSIENHLLRLEVGRQSNSVHTYGVNCRKRRFSLPLSQSHVTKHQ